MSQEEAAAKIGVDRTLVSKIERGLVPYDQAFLEAAADAYQCTTADLLHRDPFKDEIWSLINALLLLPEQQQRQLAGVIKGYLEGAVA